MKAFRIIQCASLLILTVLLGGCVFVVSSPRPPDETATLSGFTRLPTTDQLQMKIIFSQPYDKTTIVVGKTLILQFTKDANAGATLTYPDATTLIVTTTKSVNELMNFVPDDGWCLKLIGTDAGNGVVKNTSGTILDGDYDNKVGGDYKMCYRIIG